ncbi:MAG TPA: hypothetical protein VFX30_11400 [bacterium]|nr:hypothetical protein [bacterium]
MKASLHHAEGYLMGLQGLPWEAADEASPPHEDSAAFFLHEIRSGKVALQGRVKKDAEPCLEAFRDALIEAFPEAEQKSFAAAVVRLWPRWLETHLALPPDDESFRFSSETGRRVGALLKAEYEEGSAGGLALFLLDKRLHLLRVGRFLRMRGWLLGTIEHDARHSDAGVRERAGILKANLASIVLRALHNAGPDYAALAVAKLASLTRHLDAAIANLSAVEPEASRYLRNNRATVITRALHSGIFDYGEEVTEKLPAALQDLNRRIEDIGASSPEDAKKLQANKRTLVYRALTNGRLDKLRLN